MPTPRILVVRAGALGDTLMVTPLLRRLAQSTPRPEIDMLCSSAGAALLAGNPHLSRTHALRLRNLPYLLSAEKRALVKTLHERGYTSAIVLESASQYRGLAEKARIPEIRGFHTTLFDPAQHSIVNNIRAAGFPAPEGPGLDMELPVPAAATAWAKQHLAALPRPVIGLHSGYGPSGKKKNQAERLKGWALENFIAVAQDLTSRGAGIVLTGSEGDRAASEFIASSLPKTQVLDVSGRTTVPQLAAIIQALDLFISVDSGPAHMSAALGTPLIVLWGPAILAQVRPLSSTTPIRILNAAVPCAPCYGTPLMKECRRNICMEALTPAAVLTAAAALLPA